jgi:ATP-binding cassette subfamily B protein
MPYLGRTLRLVYAAAPGLTAVWVVLLILQGLLPALSVYLTRGLVNSIVATIDSGGAQPAVRLAVGFGLAMGLVLVASEALRGLAAWVRMALAERVRDAIIDLIHERSLAVDLAFYDLPEYYDHLHRAGQEASYRPVALLENFGALLQNGITLVAMMAVLLPYGLWLPVLLFLSTLPALVVVLKNARRQHEWRRSATVNERRTWYYNWLLTGREPAAEVRLYGLGPTLRETYQLLRRNLREEQLALVRREGLASLAVGFGALLAVGATMLVMVWQVLQGALNLGDLALIYQAFTQGQNLLRTLLQSVGQIYGNSLFLGDLFTFLALEPSVRDPVDPQPPAEAVGAPAVRFDRVCFNYPHTERDALRELTLEVPAGKLVAIVGSNGAGKSTLIKLLCRFYDPVAGSVELFGRDVRSMRVEDVYAHVSILFQTPVLYNMSVADNIAISRQDAGSDLEAIQQAGYFATVDELLPRLPHGYDTLLGVWFGGGTDLSVGEWRRVALARTLFREAAITVLDEPTSAMDPWAEAEWVRRFVDYARGRTVILITHRFTTARHADLICVMEDGAIIESGSHVELLAANGRYAQSFQTSP